MEDGEGGWRMWMNGRKGMLKWWRLVVVVEVKEDSAIVIPSILSNTTPFTPLTSPTAASLSPPPSLFHSSSASPPPSLLRLFSTCHLPALTPFAFPSSLVSLRSPFPSFYP